MKLPSHVTIYEVGPRDGLQNETTCVATADKIAFIEGLVDCGLSAIEITSFVSPKWIPPLADADDVARHVQRKNGVCYSALVPNAQGLKAAIAAGMKEVAVFLSATEHHNKRNLNQTIGETLKRYEQLVPAALAQGLRVRGYVSTVFGCPYEGEVDPKKPTAVAKALLAFGCYQVSLGDTIGVATPTHVERTLTHVFKDISLERVALHFHDTRGTALANLLVGLAVGVTTVDSAAGGIGGCPYAPGASGNVATEDIVNMLEGMGVVTGVDLDRLVDVSANMEKLLGRALPSKVLRATLGVRERAKKEASH